MAVRRSERIERLSGRKPWSQPRGGRGRCRRRELYRGTCRSDCRGEEGGGRQTICYVHGREEEAFQRTLLPEWFGRFVPRVRFPGCGPDPVQGVLYVVSVVVATTIDWVRDVE